MKKIVPILKNTLPVVASVGAGAVVGTVLKTFTPADAKILTKVSFGVGSIVLTSMAGDMAAKYVDKYIDSTVEEVTTIKRLYNDISTPKSNEE